MSSAPFRRPRLSEIRPSTLVLASNRDRLVPAVQRARYMAERVPWTTLQVLEGQRHICMIAPNLDLARVLDDWRQQRQAAPGRRVLRASAPGRTAP